MCVCVSSIPSPWCLAFLEKRNGHVALYLLDTLQETNLCTSAHNIIRHVNIDAAHKRLAFVVPMQWKKQKRKI